VRDREVESAPSVLRSDRVSAEGRGGHLISGIEPDPVLDKPIDDLSVAVFDGEHQWRKSILRERGREGEEDEIGGGTST
jgi:hypothetical protein